MVHPEPVGAQPGCLPNAGYAAAVAVGADLRRGGDDTNRIMVADQMNWEIKQGDVLAVLKQMPDESVQCVVTSPPYWELRDYGVDGQLGLEKTPQEYVAKMTEVFREVKRVLKDDGTLWLNLGDSYAGSNGNGYKQPLSPVNASNAGGQNINMRAVTGRVDDGLKPKDLCGIPWRVAFALQQQYEHVQIKERIDRAWLSALVDGEGCITILACSSPHGSGDSYPPVLQVRMCDAEPLVKAAQITGYGTASPKQSPPSQGGQRGSYQWRIHASRATQIIAEIYPYLLVKRKQAVIAWNHQRVRESYEVKRGQRIPSDALAKQQLCLRLIHDANHAKPIDIPSWMDEPEIKVEPGWYLRSDCIWSKPNPMPESVTDRPTKAHEYVFLMAKSARYYYDADSIREEAVWDVDGEGTIKRKERQREGLKSNPDSIKNGIRITYPSGKHGDTHGSPKTIYGLRNKRSVWTVNTQPYAEAHFATFPEKLVEPCIRAGSRIGDAVLDPFCGSGTTGVVALSLTRNFIGIELNPKYVELAEKRIGGVMPLFSPTASGQK